MYKNGSFPFRAEISESSKTHVITSSDARKGYRVKDWEKEESQPLSVVDSLQYNWIISTEQFLF